MLITRCWLCWLFSFCNTWWLTRCSLKPVPACISLSQIAQLCAAVLWLGWYLRVQFALVHLLVCAGSLSCLELVFPLLQSGQGAQQPVCGANSRVISGHSLGEHIFVCFSPELGRRGVSLCSLNEALFSAEEMKSWNLVSPDTEMFPFTGLSLLVWSPWGGKVKEGLHLQEH